VSDVAVVIPAFNAKRWLAEAIESVLSQTRPPAECFVVDDGSTDGTAAIARAFSREGVHLLSQPNSGVSRARNFGAEQATARYLAFLDADDAWLPHKLELQVNAMHASPSAGLCYGGYLNADEDLVPLNEVVPAPAKEALRRTLFLEPGGPALSSTGMIPVEVFRKVGGFKSELTTGADSDLLVRILLQWNAVCVREPLALYRQHGGQMHRNALAMERDMWHIIDSTFSVVRLPEDIQGQRRRVIAALEVTLMADAFSRSAYGTSFVHGVRAVEAHLPHAAKLVTRGLARKLKVRADART